MKAKTDNHEHVAANIRNARKRAGLGMLEFARTIEVNKETLRRIEAGINLPRFDVAQRIVNAGVATAREVLGLDPVPAAGPKSAES